MKLKKFLATSGFMLISSAVYAQYDTAVMCRACPAGTRGDGSSKACTNCGAGTYQNEVGQSQCKSVPTGNCATGAANTGYSSCLNKAGRTACNASNCSATSCSDGYYLSSGECNLCPAGSWCKNSVKNTCSAGTYSGAGASSCTPCTGNYYQPYSGKTSCLYCTTSTSGHSCTYSATESYTDTCTRSVSATCQRSVPCSDLNAQTGQTYYTCTESYSCTKQESYSCTKTRTVSRSGTQTYYYRVNSAHTSCDYYSSSSCS